MNRLHGWMRRTLACVLLLGLVPVAAAQVAAAQTVQPSGDRLLVLAYHDVRDDVAKHGDADEYAISTQNFAAQLDWLLAQGYHPVSLQQVVDDAQGKTRLPDKAVLLTFDDGLRSVYTHVFPLLRAYRFPAVAAVVTQWIDLPEGEEVDYGPRSFTRDDFMTWQQLKEMQASGLVEIASHTDGSHHGVQGNPQGSTMPAIVTHAYDPARQQYETDEAYRARLRSDLTASHDKILNQLGRAPRAVMWPYGAFNRVANDIASQVGMPVTFDLEGRDAYPSRGTAGLGRLVMMGNPTAADLAHELRRDPERDVVRAVQVDLDDVYDVDPAQQQRNLDVLIDRIYKMHPSHVFLQAFADPDGDGAADALYFPNRYLPMRQDLFGYVAWQLFTRAGVQVYAWMPALAFQPRDTAQRAALGIATQGPNETYRLDFTKPEARAMAEGIYSDLAAHAAFEGILFHDDAYLRDGELPALYPDQAPARTQALIDYTHALANAAGEWRSKLKTVRNLYPRTVLEPSSEAWFAQQLAAFNRAYDYTALMAMPWLEGAKRPEAWLDDLVQATRTQDPKFEKTIFELQTVDWRTRKPVPDDVLVAQSHALEAQGVLHFAWYPDDFVANRPSLEAAQDAMSSRIFPYVQK